MQLWSRRNFKNAVGPVTSEAAAAQSPETAETLQQMIACPNNSVALLGIKATFIRLRLIDKY